MFNIEQSVELLDNHAQIWHQVLSFISSMSLKCATELGIPDIIYKHGRPMTVLELVDALKINNAKVDGLYRLLRMLTHSGFFAKEKVLSNGEEEEGYTLTPLSLLLVETYPFSMKPYVLSLLDPIVTEPWQHLSKWLQNDDHTAFQTGHGKSFWEVKESDARFSNNFDAGMAGDTPLVSSVLIRDYKHLFEGLNSIVDVGGGTGTLAKDIANAFPHIHCTVLDLPHVVAGLHDTHNFKCVGGDMFDEIPPADAILIKRVLHNWSGEKGVNILKKCKEAIAGKGKGGKVIIIEMVVGSKNRNHISYETQLFLDLQTMTMNRGIQRTEEEWAKLISDAGFATYKITPISGTRSIIEAYP